VEVVGEDHGLLQKLFDPSFDTRNTVLVEQQPKQKYGTKGFGEAKIKRYEEQQVELETTTDTSALVVLTDTYYPGWKAYVDEAETPIYRANYTFRAVEVPAGKHTVRFSYEPLSVTIGGWISGVSLVIYGAIVLLSLRSRVTMSKKAHRI